MNKLSNIRKLIWITYYEISYGKVLYFRRKLKLWFWKPYLKSVGDGSQIHPSVLIRNPEFISIGNNTNINHGCKLFGGGGITIGSNTMIAYDVKVFSDSRNYKTQHLLKSEKGRIKKEVFIGDDVWIGAGSIILPGVIVADHAIVAAGSVVTKKVNEWEIIGGNPAKPIGNRYNTIASNIKDNIDSDNE